MRSYRPSIATDRRERSRSFQFVRAIGGRWRWAKHAGVALVLACCAPTVGTVGARFGRDADGHLHVRDVPNGLGAAKAGLEPGDEVILIEGRDVRTLSDAQLHQLLAGELGTSVRLTLLRGDQVIHARVERMSPRRHEATREQ